jgi:hemolysin III
MGWRSGRGSEKMHSMDSPRPSFNESLANIVTHALGLILSLVGAPALVWLADRVGTAETVAACAFYGVTLIFTFAASTKFHCEHGRPGDHFWLILDHICIFLLIAGTATAFAVVAIKGDERWYLLAAVWALAAAGIVFKLIYGLRWEKESAWFYVPLGWGAAMAVPALVQKFPGDALAYVIGGAVAYTVGLLYYARIGCGRVPYSHAIWHLMVLAGTSMFYLAVWEFLSEAGSA